MAISARSTLTLTLPDGSDVTLREATGDDVPTCNTCGKEAGTHLFRPSFAYRCASCLARWGKAQTVSVVITLADGTDVASEVRASLPGEGHRGPVATIP